MTPHRDKFILPMGLYLASHSVGPMTLEGQSIYINDFMHPWNLTGSNAWDEWLGLIDRFCSEIASLLGGEANDICPQTNLSSGLTKYLTALPAPETRTKIVMHSDAFPSMGFVAKALSTRGYDLHLIPSQLPAHDPAVWKETMDAHTACALITHVHSNTGVLSPVTDITQICKAAGVRSLVDIAQSAGLIPIDLMAWDADAVFGSCVKWLCGGPGAGFMWLNPKRSYDLMPEDVGWFSHENPFEFDIRDFRYASAAKRFWGGTPNVAPYAFALGGVKTIRNIGVEIIRAHNVALMKMAWPGIDPKINGGTLCLPVTDAAAKNLRAAGCQFDMRGNTARLSFHIYNTKDEAEIVANCLKPKT